MSLEPGTKARFTTALVLLMVFGAGGILGVALDRQWRSGEEAGDPTRASWDRGRREGPGRDYDPRFGDSPRNRPPGGDSARRRPPMIVDQVGLSERQKEQVDSIVDHFGREMRALHREFDTVYSARYREITETTRSEIRGILTEGQRFVYDSLLVEWENRRRDRRDDSIGDRRDRRDRGGSPDGG